MSRKKPADQDIEENLPDVMGQHLAKAESQKMSIEDMPLNSLRDYRLYNEEAARINKKLRLCKYPYKQCPVDLHPKQRIVFSRNDQPHNPLKVYVSNNIIHFDQELVPGQTYDLPEYIVHYLSEKGYPVWKWYTNKDGSKETRISHKEPRFSLRTVWSHA